MSSNPLARRVEPLGRSYAPASRSTVDLAERMNQDLHNRDPRRADEIEWCGDESGNLWLRDRRKW